MNNVFTSKHLELLEANHKVSCLEDGDAAEGKQANLSYTVRYVRKRTEFVSPARESHCGKKFLHAHTRLRSLT